MEDSGYTESPFQDALEWVMDMALPDDLCDLSGCYSTEDVGARELSTLVDWIEATLVVGSTWIDIDAIFDAASSMVQSSVSREKLMPKEEHPEWLQYYSGGHHEAG